MQTPRALKRYAGLCQLIIGCSLISAATAHANSASTLSSWDFSFQSGASFGSVIIQEPVVGKSSNVDIQSVSKARNISLGGIPAILAGTTDFSNRFGAVFSGSLLFDFPNSQISRQAFRSGVLWHIMGGARRLVRGQNDGDYFLVSRSKTQLSVLLQTALFNFSASTQDLSTEISGSTFEMRLGLRYRFDFSVVSAGGIELSSTIYSFPASKERLKSQSSEITLFWQM